MIDSAALARELGTIALQHLSVGYGDLVASFAAAEELRGLMLEQGPAAVVASDHPAVTNRQKLNREFVTRAEQQAEAAMRDRIRQAFPHDGILGEELGATESAGGNDRLWVLDPVDGTSAMVRVALAEAFGVELPAPTPAFGVTIAVVDGDEAEVGVVGELRPEKGGLVLSHVWVGVQGEVTTCDGAPVSVPSAPGSLAAATLACTVPEVMFSTPEMWSGFQALLDRTAIFLPDQNCVGFMRLLGGDVHVVVERDLTLPDAAALIPVLTGAGIMVTDHDGGPVGFDADRRAGEYALLAASPDLHYSALQAVRGGVPGAQSRFPGHADRHQGYARKFT
jgi:fructose-1,6-bisphosphatase/inositol monophosphatase family enzyme